jgi:hypothetical protein
MDVPDEIIETPMKNVKPPAVLEVPVPLISDDHVRHIFKSVGGTTIEQPRPDLLGGAV